MSAISSTTVEVVDVSAPTIYSDAEDTSLDGWRLSDKTPAGSALENVVDPDFADYRAIQTTSSGVQNSFILGNTNLARGWNNSLQTNVSWRSRADENFRVYIRVTTPDGWRYLWYDSRSVDTLANSKGNYIHHGLGAESKDGQWHYYTRDLKADLAAAQPDNTIIAVHAMVIRGNVMIDDVTLSADVQSPPPPPPPEAPITPVNVTPLVDTKIEAGTTQSFIWQEQVVASAYDFHLFDRVSAELTFVYDIDPTLAYSAGLCSLDAAIDLPVNDNHAWRVRAKNETGISAWSRSEFDVIEPITVIPNLPVISQPTDNAAFDLNATIELRWQADPLASSYDFGLSDPFTETTTYNSAIDPASICTATTCTLSTVTDLPVGDGYQLRIRANNRLGSTDWSERTFSVAEPVTEPPETPTNIVPEVGVELVEGRSVEFSWTETATSASYDFHFFDNVSKALQFTNALSASDICVDGVCRLTTVVDLPVFENHAWRVRASNAAGKSNWSRSVFDVIPVPDLNPATPNNISPEPNAILATSSSQLFTWEPVAGADTYDFHLFDVIDGELPYVLNLNAASNL